jgi:hypothetical protein
VDGIPAARLRNCIIFHLDYRKSEWHEVNLTEGYMRRFIEKWGMYGARKLHEGTPPGWTPPPPPQFESIAQEFQSMVHAFMDEHQARQFFLHLPYETRDCLRFNDGSVAVLPTGGYGPKDFTREPWESVLRMRDEKWRKAKEDSIK